MPLSIKHLFDDSNELSKSCQFRENIAAFFAFPTTASFNLCISAALAVHRIVILPVLIVCRGTTNNSLKLFSKFSHHHQISTHFLNLALITCVYHDKL